MKEFTKALRNWKILLRLNKTILTIIFAIKMSKNNHNLTIKQL